MLSHPFPGLSVVYSEKDDGSIQVFDQAKNFLDNIVPKSVHPVMLGITHGSRVLEVANAKKPIADADAAFTTAPDVALLFRMADCVPIVLFDPKKKALALIHGSWRTLLQNIVQITMLKFQVWYDVKPSDMRVWLGPSIQACCNKVEEESIQSKFGDWRPYLIKKNGEVHLDLQSFVKDNLMKNGVQKKHIIDTGLCTYHQEERFFSHRRSTERSQKKDDGRMITAVWMENS